MNKLYKISLPVLVMFGFIANAQAALYVEYSQPMRDLLANSSIKRFVKTAVANQSQVVLFSNEIAKEKISGNKVITCLTEDRLEGDCHANNDLALISDEPTTLAVVANAFSASYKSGAILFSSISDKSITVLKTLLPNSTFSLFASPVINGKQLYYLSFDAANLSASDLVGIAPFKDKSIRACSPTCSPQRHIDMTACFKQFSSAYHLPGRIEKIGYEFPNLEKGKSCDALKLDTPDLRQVSGWKQVKIKGHTEFYTKLQYCNGNPLEIIPPSVEVDMKLQVIRADKERFKSLAPKLNNLLVKTIANLNSETDYLKASEYTIKIAAENCQ